MRGFSDNENGKNFYIFCRPYPANFHDSERPETKTNKQKRTKQRKQKKRQQKYQLQQNPLKTFFLVILLMLKEQLSFAVHMNNIFN